MAKSKKRKKNHSKSTDQQLQTRLIAVLVLFILIIASMRLGSVGIFLDRIGGYLLGVFAGLIYILGIFVAIYVIFEGHLPNMWGPKAVGAYLVLFSLLLFASAPINPEITGLAVLKQFQLETTAVRGGFLGALFFGVFSSLFARLGTQILSVFVGLIGVCLIVGRAYFDMMRLRLNQQKQSLQKKHNERQKQLANDKPKKTKIFFPERSFEDEKHKVNEEPHINVAIEQDDLVKPEIIRSEPKPMMMNEVHDQKEDIPFDMADLVIETKAETNDEKEVPVITGKVESNPNYQLPPLSLLKQPKVVKGQKNAAATLAKENAIKLSNVLNEFGVHAKVSEIYIGPAVTKYELKLETGTRVNRISSLQDDIKLALAAKDIRIEAPIPGKSAVGVEIPNLESTTVSFREVLKDIPEKKKDSHLLVPLGKDVMGMSVFAELDKMPHLLIAGATGSGKSVCVNGIICSLLMRTKPEEVRLLLVDPKKVELSNYNGIPHLISPVVTDPKKAAKALHRVVEEMERRYELFASVNARNIAGYNEYAKLHNESKDEENHLEILPFIVVILDEVADLMMVASKDVEDCIMRISQMARAAGIHLIVATQRPSTDVITGVVKANIPSRIAFAVSSSIDSRTILDMSGAEKLLGRGDMLFSPMGASAPVRVQGSFVSDEEVEAIVQYVSKQQEAVYDENFVNLDKTETNSCGYEETDEEYEACREFVIQTQKVSTSLLQRKFRIGYNKAARIIDQLEENGVIGPQIGNKPREIYIRKYEEE